MRGLITLQLFYTKIESLYLVIFLYIFLNKDGYPNV
jgi:hypothetical protein